MNKSYTIGEVEKITGISKDRLRNYDKLGLLTPTKEEGNCYRKYNEKDIVEILSIEHMRSMDFGMKDIKVIREKGDIETYFNIVSNKKIEIDNKINDLLNIKMFIQNTYDEILRIKEFLGDFTIKEMAKFQVVKELSGSDAFDEYENARKLREKENPIIKSMMREITFNEKGILSNQVLMVEIADPFDIMYGRCLYTIVKEDIHEGDILFDTYQKCMQWLAEKEENHLGVAYVKPMLIGNEVNGLVTFLEIYIPLGRKND